MSVSARFYVSKIEKTPSDYIGVTLLPVTRSVQRTPEEIAADPSYRGFNGDWSKYTPSGKFEMNVSVESGAASWFEEHLGKDVAITFDEVD